MKRGKYLTRLRLKSGLSQNDVAEKLNYSPQLVSLWEKDKSDIDIRIMSKYAKILNVDLKSFITLKDKKRNNHCEEKEFDISKFANNLRFLRKDKKLLQNDIAKKTKTNVKTIGSWESGASTPTISNFITLCKIFNKTFDELYFVCENEEAEPVKKKKLVLIFAPLAVLLIGGTCAGVVLGINSMKKADTSEASISISVEHVHKFSTSTIEATYDSPGSITYTCECGYTYTETIPQLVHQYSENYSYDNHFHYRSCIDEGYEDLFIDKGAHDIVSEIEGNITKYRCSACDFSYTTEDYIVIVDLLNEEGKPEYSVSQKNDMYLTIMNANKYQFVSLGFKVMLKDDPDMFATGTYPVGEDCLDIPNYTLFRIDHYLFTPFPDLLVPGNVIELTFFPPDSDPDLLSVDCKPLYISIIE